MALTWGGIFVEGDATAQVIAVLRCGLPLEPINDLLGHCNSAGLGYTLTVTLSSVQKGVLYIFFLSTFVSVLEILLFAVAEMIQEYVLVSYRVEKQCGEGKQNRGRGIRVLTTLLFEISKNP